MAAARRFCWLGRLALGLPLLAACSQGAEITTGSTVRSASPSSAFVLPPPGGPAIVSVVERRYANATEQEISLATNATTVGQNWFQVRLFGPVDPRLAGQTALSTRPISFGHMNAEARAALPNVGMARSPYYVQNRYGPFGYSLGRSGADLCLYGWQNIRSRPALIGNNGAIDIRVRLCQAGGSEQELLSVMYGYTVSAYFGDSNWNPYGRPPSPSPTLGQAGAEIYPLGLPRAEGLSTEPPPPPQVPTRRSVVRQPVAAPVQPTPRGPLVPPPPEATSEQPVVPPPSGSD